LKELKAEKVDSWQKMMDANRAEMELESTKLSFQLQTYQVLKIFCFSLKLMFYN
jgi:hypothetical protein